MEIKTVFLRPEEDAAGKEPHTRIPTFRRHWEGTLLSKSVPVEEPGPGTLQSQWLLSASLSGVIPSQEMKCTPNPHRGLETTGGFSRRKRSKSETGFMRKCWALLVG